VLRLVDVEFGALRRLVQSGGQRGVEGIAVATGDVQQPHGSSLPFHERSDRRRLVPADDEVTFLTFQW
jgi:hypothetical protein